MAWVTVIVGLVGLVLGNLLNRSMEYRKWRRIERHKACSQLLEASQATVIVAAWRANARKPVSDSLQPITDDFKSVMESTFRNPLLLRFLKAGAKFMVRKANPDVSVKDFDETISGFIASVNNRSMAGVEDLLTERLGLGRDGILTQFREGANRLGVAIEAVELICPSKVVDAGWRLYYAAIDLLQSSEQDTVEKQEKMQAEYGSARNEFVLAARRDIVGKRNGQRSGIPPTGRSRIDEEEAAPSQAHAATVGTGHPLQTPSDGNTAGTPSPRQSQRELKP